MVDRATSESPPFHHSVDEIVTLGKRVERRRKVGWISSAGAAVAVFAVVAAVVTPSLLRHQPTGATGAAAQPASVPFTVPAAPFTYTFGAYRVGKLHVLQPTDVSTAYQIAPVYDDTVPANDKSVPVQTTPPKFAKPLLYAYLTLYQPGAYDPTKLQDPQHVTIAGHPGLQTIATVTGENVINLAWQYLPNAWAVITTDSNQPDDPSAKQVQQLAAGLQPAATPVAAKVPFTMSYVPAGYKLDEVAMRAMAGLNGIATAEDGDYAGALFSKPPLPTTGLSEPFGGIDGNDPAGSFQIFVTRAVDSNQHPSPGISCENGFCNRWADNNAVNIQVSSGGRLSNADMTKILNGITLGNVHDDSTWTVVTTAIPQ